MRRVRRGAFASKALAGGLAALSGPDRSLATDLVYGVLRLERYLDACLAPWLAQPERLPGEVRDALRSGAFELLERGLPRPVATNEWVEVVKARYGRLAGLVNAVLRRLEPLPDLPPALRFSVPEWLYDEWRALFGEEGAARAAAGMVAPEPLWLLAYHEEAAARLAAEGCEVAPGPLTGTLALRAPKPLPQLAAFREGLVQAQNPASVAVMHHLEPEAGARVLDLASGHGVKAAQLAARGCKVVSVERDPRKLEAAARNLARLGLKAEQLVFDLRDAPGLEPAPFVLLDAPCSGTGTLRGHPEIKSRLTPEVLQGLAALQGELLSSAAELTAPGGRLMYAVCALTRAETTEQIARFLAARPDFEALPLAPLLPGPAAAHGRFILPENGLDGFYLALLRRSR